MSVSVVNSLTSLYCILTKKMPKKDFLLLYWYKDCCVKINVCWRALFRKHVKLVLAAARMAEVNSQTSSTSTLDYMDMTSEGFETDRKRGREDDGDGVPDQNKKTKTSDDNDDRMDDGNLFTKVNILPL